MPLPLSPVARRATPPAQALPTLLCLLLLVAGTRASAQDPAAGQPAYAFSPYADLLALHHDSGLPTERLVARYYAIHDAAISAGDSSRAAVALSFLVWQHNKLQQRDRMFRAYERALLTLPRKPEREAAFRIYQLRARIAARRQRPQEAWPWIARMDSVAREAGGALFANKVAATRSIIYRREGKQAEALEAAERAYELAQGSPYRFDRLISYITLANLHARAGRAEAIRRWADSLAAHLRPDADELYHFAVVRLRAEAAMAEGGWARAVSLIDSAAARFDGNFRAKDNINLMRLRADYLLEGGKYAEAIAQLNRIIAESEPVGISVEEALFERGEAKLRLGRTAGALADMERAYQLNVDDGSYGQAAGYASALSGHYERLGRTAEAFAWYRRADRFGDSVATAEQRAREDVVYMREEARLRRAETRSARLEAAAATRNNRLLIGLLFALAAAVAVGVYAMTQRRRAQEARLRRSETQRRLRELQLESRTQQVNTQALTLAQKSTLLAELQQELGHLRQAAAHGSLTVQHLGKLERSIDTHTSASEDWAAYVDSTNELSRGTYDALRARHPGLTDKDMRLLALARLNLSTKEVAQSLSISEAGVKKARYRLRKKLGLAPGASIRAYVDGFDPKPAAPGA